MNDEDKITFAFRLVAPFFTARLADADYQL